MRPAAIMMGLINATSPSMTLQSLLNIAIKKYEKIILYVQNPQMLIANYRNIPETHNHIRIKNIYVGTFCKSGHFGDKNCISAPP